MPVFVILLVLFFVVPLVEVLLFVQVGSAIGVLKTIVLVVLTAVIGAVLIRLQGVTTLLTIQTKLGRGEVPAQALFDGLALLIAGALLMTPGFFTDALGFTLLVPAFRRRVFPWLLKNGLRAQLAKRGMHAQAFYAHRQSQQTDADLSDRVEVFQARQSRTRPLRERTDTGRTIDGEVIDDE